jgi:hypothetical protein
MNRLFIGLGTIACLGFSSIADAANGSVAGAMPADYWRAVKRNEAKAKPVPVACAQSADNAACKSERRARRT